MSKYIGSVCRLCRREGIKLFLKGYRCYTEKCSLDRRKYPPGVHTVKKRYTEYGLQLREKQKIKRYYGVLERQFRRFFNIAEKMRGKTGDNLLILLERRLDNIVYSIGFAVSKRQARNFITSKFILVNGRRITIPSYHVEEGDVIEISDKKQENVLIKENIKNAISLNRIPDWLLLDSDELKGEMLRLPNREDIKMPFKEYMVVELYSK